MPYVIIAQQHEYIELYLVPLAPFDGCHHSVKRTLTGKVHTVMIMEFLRAVQAYSYEELMLMKKLTPLFVKQYSVGL